MNVLDLFSGIGGFSLGLERAGMRTVAFCEIEPYCRAVLRKHWPGVPIFEDVRTLSAADISAPIDVICGGFPCQPFSTSGKRSGNEDHRALWPEYRRIVEELRPAWVIGENVVGFVSLGLDAMLDDLENMGYSTRTFDIPACGVGRNQYRRRIWVVAYPMRWNEEMGRNISGGRREQEQVSRHSPSAWESEPEMVRMVNGVPPWMDELRAYGNSVVPAIPEIIGRAIMQAEGLA